MKKREAMKTAKKLAKRHGKSFIVHVAYYKLAWWHLWKTPCYDWCSLNYWCWMKRDGLLWRSTLVVIIRPDGTIDK